MRRPKPTLVDLLTRDIARDPGDAPVVDVQDAVLAQDMGWVEEQLVAEDRPEAAEQQRPRPAHDGDCQAGEDDRPDHDERLLGGIGTGRLRRSHGAESGGEAA